MIRRIARPLLGSYFIYSGYNTLRDPADTAQASAGVVEKAQETFPDAPLPANPTTWARAVGGAQVGGGALLAIGRLPRVSALTLAGTLAATTATENQFWTETDPAARQEATVHFLKNVSLIGGLIIAGFDTEGKPGVVWRTKSASRRAADKASATVAAITPGVAVAPALEDRAGDLREKAQEAAEKLGDKLSHARDLAEENASQAAEKAAPVVSSLAETASAKASELTAAASSKIADLREHAPEYAEQAKGRAQHLAVKAQEKAQEKAPGYLEQARHLAETAQDRAPGYLDQARGQARSLAETAQGKAPGYLEQAKWLAEKAQGKAPEPKKNIVQRLLSK